MANRAIIYRLYPTASQKLLLTKTFGCCRFVYNRLLSVQQERYKMVKSIFQEHMPITFVTGS